ncbi:MAG: acyltransferase [Sphingomonadales bacterium]|nr:acyltransferase [Sphingomonadales bacterium]
MLDGWRAVSILAVMAGHWVPMGPKAWNLNAIVAGTGMALFFILSGFLITQLLLRDDRVLPFLIRRLFRIMPLVWLAIAALALMFPANRELLGANLAFYANLPPSRLMEGGNHLWSLCVEVQFYAAVALIVGLAGRRGLYLLPLLALAVTGLRIHDGETVSIVTWHRIDEILAGCTLGLLVHHLGPDSALRRLPKWLPFVLAIGLLAASSPELRAWNYLRPYLAAATIGSSLYASPEWMRRVWTGAAARYVAEISYALYVVHGVLTATWLGGTDASKLARYARRPLLIGASFALAHLSTFYYEQRFTTLGKRLARQLADGGRPAAAAAR